MSDELELVRQALPDGYELLGVLGAGGQGAVFRCRRNGEEVALKLFGPTDRERLRREVEMLQKADCESLIKLVDHRDLVIQGTTVPMLVYEFARGKNLREKLVAGWIASGAELMSLGKSIGTAIECLWALRIVHRDIKPENIIACDDGSFVLVDVGFAQHLDLSTITQGGQPGTNGYRSPEQCAGRKRLTVHSDVFSLGVTLFEVGTGKHPWGRNQLEMLRQPPAPMLALRQDMSPRLAGLIHSMLSNRPGQRPTSIGRRFAQLSEEGIE